MFVGHAAAALAAKPLAPRLNLGLALVAAYWADIVWPLLLFAGVERVEIEPGNTAFTPLHFVHYPWTHSLAAAVAWSVIVGAMFLRKGVLSAGILGLLVFSHWLLDAVSHGPDLPLWPGGSLKVGLGLWNSVPATILVECGLFAAGLLLYLRSAPARDRTGVFAFWGLIAFLLLAYFGNAFGPPPPSVTAIAWSGIGGGILFGFWAAWADRHRGKEE